LETKLTWQPLKQEPDPYELAVYDVIRNSLPPLFAETLDAPRRMPLQSVRLRDGSEFMVDYAVAPGEAPLWNGRPTIGYRLAGHAGTSGLARRFDGQALVDVRTGAFADLRIVFEETSAAKR